MELSDLELYSSMNKYIYAWEMISGYYFKNDDNKQIVLKNIVKVCNKNNRAINEIKNLEMAMKIIYGMFELIIKNVNKERYSDNELLLEFNNYIISCEYVDLLLTYEVINEISDNVIIRG